MAEERYSDSVESDSTLTPEMDQVPLTPDKIIENLNSALVELRETGDYLSYATLIEICFQSKQEEFDTESKSRMLVALYNILKENHDIVYEIGWDLPSLLIEYIASTWDLKFTLRDNEGITAIMKIFELLSLYGNPKEIFLRSCELLNAMKFEEMNAFEGNYYGEEFYYKLISHNLIELLNSSLKRIKTRYPSRFLSKLIITMINFLNTNFKYVIETRIFIFRRYYVFVRQFGGLELPDDISNVDPDELEKVADEENYLQRKLLTSFLTHFISLTIGMEVLLWTYDYYAEKVHNPKSKFRLPDLEPATVVNTDTTDTTEAENRVWPFATRDEESWDPVLLRCSQLAESLDMDLEELFSIQLKETTDLFIKLDHSKSLNELNDELYTLVINDFNSKVRPQKTIPISDQGVLFLFTHLVNKDSLYKDYIVPDITIEKIIKLAVRSLVPTLLNPSLCSVSLVDAILFWSWYAVKNDPNLATGLQKIEPVFLNVYLQNLISLSSLNPNAASRMIIFTLITKVLTLLDEKLSYDFIMDSIESCPYDNARLALIGILKDLLIRPRSVQSLSDSLAKVDLNKDIDDTVPAATTTTTSSGKPTAPKLPPRQPPTYINLTVERKRHLLKELDHQLDHFFNNKEKGKMELSIILSFLNLLIAIKSKLLPDEIAKVTKNVDLKVKKYKQEIAKSGKDDDLNIDFLTLATDFLSKKED